MDWAGLAAALGPGLGNLFGAGANYFNDQWKNPADAAKGTLANIPGQMQQYYNPYIQAGQGAIPALQGQYGNLLNDPGGFMNQMGQGYQKSPGFDYALKTALDASKHAAAAGGMAGSPQAQTQSMGIATNLANQDYNQWLSNAMNLYGRGLSGQENMYNTGFQGSTDLAKNIADVMAKQSELAYKGQQAENEHQQGQQGGLWGGIGSLVGAALPFLF